MSPEQSQALGPAAPNWYGSPTWARANAMAVATTAALGWGPDAGGALGGAAGLLGPGDGTVGGVGTGGAVGVGTGAEGAGDGWLGREGMPGDGAPGDGDG